MNLRKVTDLREAEQIYQKHIAVDFPPKERQPLSYFLRMLGEASTDMYVWEAEGRPGAYMVLRERDGYILLQYFAVFEGLRGKGTGSRMLGEISSMFGDRKGLLAEVEHRDFAGDAEDLAVRGRRVTFYEQCGYRCVDDFDLVLFGEHYHVMLQPLGEDRTGDPEYIYGMFRRMYDGIPEQYIEGFAGKVRL